MKTKSFFNTNSLLTKINQIPEKKESVKSKGIYHAILYYLGDDNEKTQAKPELINSPDDLMNLGKVLSLIYKYNGNIPPKIKNILNDHLIEALDIIETLYSTQHLNENISTYFNNIDAGTTRNPSSSLL